jgi:hypothetical protein
LSNDFTFIPPPHNVAYVTNGCVQRGHSQP